MAEEKNVSINSENVTANVDDVNSYISADESFVMNSFSDKEILLNVSSISDLCATWTNRVNSLNLTSERITSDFSIFTSYGILSNYFTSLSTAVNFLTQNVSEINKQISSAKEQQIIVDDDYSVEQDQVYYDYNTNIGSNSDSGSNTTVNNNNYDTNINNNTVSNTNNGNSGSSAPNSVEITTNTLSILSLQDYLGLSIALGSIVKTSNLSLSQLLSTNNATIVKDMLLKSPNVSETIKQIIVSMDPNVLIAELKMLVSNGTINVVDSENIKYLHDYLGNIAKTNNTTIGELVTDSNKKGLLYDSVNYYKGAVNHFNNISNNGIISIRRDLLNIYDGDGISDMDSNVVSSVRSIIDSLASDSHSSYEYLLNNGKAIVDAVSTVSDSKSFVGALADCDTNNLQGVVNNLFNDMG